MRSRASRPFVTRCPEVSKNSHIGYQLVRFVILDENRHFGPLGLGSSPVAISFDSVKWDWLVSRSSLSVQILSSCCGLSNIILNQLAEGQRITEIVCVQNFHNLAHRGDDTFMMLSPNKG